MRQVYESKGRVFESPWAHLKFPAVASASCERVDTPLGCDALELMDAAVREDEV